MTLKDVWELVRRLMRFGPLMTMATIGIVWCGGLISLITYFPPSKTIANKVNFLCYFCWLPFTVTNFFKAILLGPGYAPKGWKPKVPGDEQFLQFCQVCQGFKPPRAHHCRKCQRCCLKMDHHCIWLSQCVGYRNQASFMYFLFGAVFGALHGTFHIIFFSYQQLWVRLTLQPKLVLGVMISSGFGIGTVIAVGVLLYSQLQIVFTNMTGIESWIVEKANWRLNEDKKDEEKTQFNYPYDLGRSANFWQVFGKDERIDGFYFPVKEGCNIYSLTIEQLLQKKIKEVRSVPFKCIKSYSGRKCPFLSFPKIAIFTPILSDLLPIEEGDDIIITRGKKHWYYGYKAGNKETRGFMPKTALQPVEEPKKEL
ncbi:Oidioi.mRNA.OKI2018_I69.PAR.g9917.t1.cds [Oikopleura dioica]|uniref:Palmitoyltransferase n=1 Tax=Oikopleura dioica TaxID=34765 RepID=A0ABN7RMV9_OIKDI|nr:Oidioi.mRNA.OKI2018_I69.PAR.g9917.t1.cds [Oikopleura dioica]